MVAGIDSSDSRRHSCSGPVAGTPGAFYRIRRRGLGILTCRELLRDVRNKAQGMEISGSLKVALGYDADEPLGEEKGRKKSLG